ncbi:MAG: serine/threonine-protein kinase [Phycisphaerales bacterium]
MSSLARVREVFARAVEVEGGDRERVLLEECGGDGALRAEVEALLRASAEARSFMERAPSAVDLGELAAIAGADSGTFRRGEKFGSFTLLEPIGHGGMGVVYLAEQERPRRTVALKLIRSPFLTAQLLKRFEQEAQVLGLLRHPGIAQIYEAGSAPGPDGRLQPYYAMELVRGRPLIAYAAERSLGVRERLQLFALICDAVQHAHQKGVIHRDLKPANILVEEGEASSGGSYPGAPQTSGGAQPKVLDFGVARITDSDIAVTTVGTDVGQLVGTIPYMSPEQVRGDSRAIDTRSDVYALGVVLYELLTGRLPYDVRGKAIAAAAVTIAHEEPTSPGRASPSLRGDIETIVLKALEKAPERRYQSAAEMAADVRRHLADMPIVARPATTAYQLRKFARRNRALVGGVVAAFVLLVAGVVGTSVGLVRARAAQRLAEQREAEAQVSAKTARHTARFMTDMFASIDPVEGGSRSVTVLEVLDRAAAGVGDALAEEPEVEVEARLTLASSYTNLTEFAKADALLGPALERTRSIAPGGSVLEARVLMEAARARMEQRKFEEAVTLATKALAMVRSEAPQDRQLLALALSLQGQALSVATRHTEAMAPLREAAEIYGAGVATQPQPYIDTMTMLAGVISNSGEPGSAQRAQEAYDTALKVMDERGSLPAKRAGTLHNYANFLYRQNRPAEAEKVYREALALREQALGPDNHNTLGTRRMLASTLTNLGRYAEAEELHARVLADTRRLLGNSVELSRSLAEFAELKRRMQKLDEAESLVLEAIEVARPIDPLQTADAQRRLANIYVSRKQPRKALPLYRDFVAYQRSREVTSSSFAGVLSDYGQVLLLCEEYAEAEGVLREARERIHNATQDPRSRGKAAFRLGTALFKLGRSAEAEPLVREACEALHGDPQSKGMLERLAEVLEALGRPAEAEEARRQAAGVSAG